MAAKAVTSKAAPKSAPLASVAKGAKPAAAKPVAAKAVVAKGVKAPAPLTVTSKHLAAQLAEKHTIAKKEADVLMNDVFGMVVDHLKGGDRVRIAGLGIIEVKSRAARMGRNPATGAAIEIKASKKVAFRAAKELKDAI